ncbi:MAG: hypothetical protein PHC60_03480 [Heliobacteriaceae bacterium]|nr:hypothetical protein [Heliobacteriaceae bacterium]MDD4587442.1 hypothetical protein [Heliobacteriaceae bacterium]
MWICPACNGLSPVTVPCPNCRTPLDDHGPVEDFAQPYSPYDVDNELDNLVAGPTTGRCCHLLVCPRCGTDHRMALSLKLI